MAWLVKKKGERPPSKWFLSANGGGRLSTESRLYAARWRGEWASGFDYDSKGMRMGEATRNDAPEWWFSGINCMFQGGYDEYDAEVREMARKEHSTSV